jgi:hypothetical protein
MSSGVREAFVAGEPLVGRGVVDAGPQAGAGFVGDAAAGRVVVEIDRPGRAVRLRLLLGWRSVVGGGRGLGGAVLEAFHAATVTRLAALASAAPPAPTATGATGAGPVGAGGGALDAVTVSRAWEDLREFRRRLTEMHAASRELTENGLPVTVTVQGGQIVRIEPDGPWAASASDDRIQSGVGHALTAALGDIVESQGRALEGCPYLLAVLQRAGAALPFTLPAMDPPGPAPPPPPAPGPPGAARPAWAPPPGWRAAVDDPARSPAAPPAPAVPAPRARVPTTNPDW